MATVAVLPCLLCRKELPPIPADHEEHLEEEHKIKFHVGWIVRKTLKERRRTSENAADNDRDNSKEDSMETDTEMDEDDIDDMYFQSERKEHPVQNEKIGDDENSTNKEEKLLQEETDVKDIEMMTIDTADKESTDSPATKTDKCCTHCSKLVKEETDVKDIEMVTIVTAGKDHIDSPTTDNYKCCSHYCEEIYEKPFTSTFNAKLKAENLSHECHWEDWCNDRVPKMGQKGPKNKTEIIKYVCTWQGCEKMSTKKDEMKQHLMIHQNTSSRKESLKLIQSRVGPQKVTVVPVPSNQTKLYQTAVNVYKCDNCPKQFSRQDTLKRHKIGCSEIEIIHMEEKKHKCQKCGKQFLKEDHLKKHKIGCVEKIVIVPVAVKKLKCVKCGEQFLKEDQLKLHTVGCFKTELTQMKGKQYKCEKCGSQYAREDQLKRHKIACVPIKKIKMEEEKPKIEKIKMEEKKPKFEKIKIEDKKPKIEKCINCKKTFSKQDDLKKHEIECLEIDPSNVRQSGRRRSVRAVNYCEDED